MLWQVAAIAFGHPFVLGRSFAGRLILLLLLGLADRNLEVLEGQLPIILTQLLRLLAMARMVQLGDPLAESGLSSHHDRQMLKTFDDVFQFRSPRGRRLQGFERRAVIGRQNGEIKVFGSIGHGHGQIYNTT